MAKRKATKRMKCKRVRVRGKTFKVCAVPKRRKGRR